MSWTGRGRVTGSQQPAALEADAGRAPLLHHNLLDGRRGAHGAAGVLGHSARQRRRHRPAPALWEVHHRVRLVKLVHHEGHHGGQSAVRGQPLQQKGDQVEVVLEEGVAHAVRLQVEGGGDLLRVQDHVEEGSRVARAKREQHARVAAHRSRGQRGDALGQRHQLLREPVPVLPCRRAAVPAQDLHEVLGADGELVPFGNLGKVRAPSVIVDPLGLLANHLEDVLERVRARVRAQAAVQRRARLELEDRLRLLGQQLRRDRLAVHVDVELVRAAANLVVRLQHRDLEPLRREQAGARQATQAGTDHDDVHLFRSRCASPDGRRAQPQRRRMRGCEAEASGGGQRDQQCGEGGEMILPGWRHDSVCANRRCANLFCAC